MLARRIFILLTLTAVGVAVAGAPASASCAAAQGTLKDRLDDAQYAFVGTVSATRSNGRIADVDVESAWRGSVTSPTTVAGAEGSPGSISSVDRSYEVGRRYLFVPYARDSDGYRDNACTDTREWNDRLGRLAPVAATDVAPPRAEPGDAGDDAGGAAAPSVRPVAAAATWPSWAIGAIAIAAAAVFAVRRARCPRQATP